MRNIGVYNFGYQLISETFGQQFSVYRPDFTQIDQTPALVATLPLKVSIGGAKFAIPKLRGADYFTVTGDRYYFLPGDIIVPTSTTSQFPPITILNYDEGYPCVGFRTSRKCNIDYSLNPDGSDNAVYTNVYFDWASDTSPGGALLDQLSETLSISTKKIIVWTRTNLQPQNTAIQAGWKITEIDGTQRVRYVVKSLTQIGNLSIFNVDNDPVGI